jgi:uncharacterized membrane protein YfcA
MHALLGLGDPLTLFIICLGAVVTSAVHGATGVAGGFLMAALLAPLIGVQAVVPVMTVMMLISHTSRTLLNRRQVDGRALALVALPSLPCIALTAYFYQQLPIALIGFLMGTIIVSSIPLRRLGTRFGQTSPRTLGLMGCVYGGLSGASIGPGMLITPFLLGFGLRKEHFVATLAAIALTTNVIRFTTYSVSGLYLWSDLMLGALIGLLTIPGNWIGRSVLRKLSTNTHLVVVEALSVVGALQFFYLGFKSLT